MLGDQVVMTPAFFGSEPVTATSGRYAGTTILQDEQDRGLAFLRSLDDEQRGRAVISVSKTGNNNIGEAFKDNVVLDFAGVAGADLPPAQQESLLDLIALYVGNMRDGHAKVKMEEVRQHLANTYFAWIGASDPGGVYYYRIHSPVVLIEFDHQLPVALRSSGPRVPVREHVHTVTRTPNGNDYGKDVLRQHYEQHNHDPSHGH